MLDRYGVSFSFSGQFASVCLDYVISEISDPCFALFCSFAALVLLLIQ